MKNREVFDWVIDFFHRQLDQEELKQLTKLREEKSFESDFVFYLQLLKAKNLWGEEGVAWRINDARKTQNQANAILSRTLHKTGISAVAAVGLILVLFSFIFLRINSRVTNLLVQPYPDILTPYYASEGFSTDTVKKELVLDAMIPYSLGDFSSVAKSMDTLQKKYPDDVVIRFYFHYTSYQAGKSANETLGMLSDQSDLDVELLYRAAYDWKNGYYLKSFRVFNQLTQSSDSLIAKKADEIW